jgi:hypothetical protein
MSKILSPDELNKALAELDSAPETMSDKNLKRSASQLNIPKNVGTVRSAEHRAATSAGLSRYLATEEGFAQRSAAMKAKFAAKGHHMSRACTIDGATIYPSLQALIRALGQGKAGAKHPNFRYVDEK